MKKNKILLSALALITVPTAFIPLVSCGNKNATVTFSKTDGIELTGELTISVAKGTKFKDLKKPEYKLLADYYFFGWTKNGVILKDEDEIKDNTTIVCEARYTKAGEDYSIDFYDDTKEAKIFYIKGGKAKENMVLPAIVYKNNQPYTVTSFNANILNDFPVVKTLTLPHTLTKFEPITIDSDSNLTNVFIDPNSTIFTTRDENGNELNTVINLQTKELLQAISPGEIYNVPKIVKKISENAFKENQRLNKVVLHDGITEICQSAFEGSSLAWINLPNSLEKIGTDAFKQCGLSEIILPNKKMELGRNIFAGSNLRKIVIPSNIETIPDWCCSDCKKLVDVQIQDGVKKIDQAAFAGCSSLTKVSIPDSVTSYGGGCFSECSNLREIKLSLNAPQLVGRMFAFCGLTGKLEIPEGITGIGPECFEGNNFDEIYIPSTVTSISGHAFMPSDKLEGKFNLKSIKVNPKNEFFTSQDESGNECNVLMCKKNTAAFSAGDIIQGCINSVIPSNVKRITEYSFFCIDVPTINIGGNVTEIMGHAFQQSHVQNIIIGKNVSAIDDYAFYFTKQRSSIKVDPENTTFTSRDTSNNEVNCIMNSARTEIKLGCADTEFVNTITSLSKFSFCACNLTYMFIPTTVTSIDHYAFYGCNDLVFLWIPDSITFLGESICGYTEKLQDIYINKDFASGVPEGWSSSAFDKVLAKGTMHLKNLTEEAKTKFLEKYSYLSEWEFKNIEI